MWQWYESTPVADIAVNRYQSGISSPESYRTSKYPQLVEVGVEVRIDAGLILITRVCLGAAKCTLRPPCWRQREVNATLCLWTRNWNWEQEYVLGLGGMKSQTWYWLVSARPY